MSSGSARRSGSGGSGVGRSHGPRTVAVTAGTIPGKCLQLGLLDVVAVDLVPVVMGGCHPFFPGSPLEDVPLGDPQVCVASERVTHLRMPVLRPVPS